MDIKRKPKKKKKKKEEMCHFCRGIFVTIKPGVKAIFKVSRNPATSTLLNKSIGPVHREFYDFTKEKVFCALTLISHYQIFAISHNFEITSDREKLVYITFSIIVVLITCHRDYIISFDKMEFCHDFMKPEGKKINMSRLSRTRYACEKY